MDIRPSDKAMRWLGPAVVFAVFAVIIFGSPPIRDGVCTGAPDEHCLRDWISATSGWFAGVAAFISIVFLAQQVKDARRQHQNAEMQKLSNQANTARQVIIAISNARLAIEARRNQWVKVEAERSGVALDRFIGFTKASIEDFRRRVFDDFETLISTPYPIEQVRSRLQTQAEYLASIRKVMFQDNPNAASLLDGMIETLRGTVDFDVAFCDHTEKLANAIVTKWDTAQALILD